MRFFRFNSKLNCNLSEKILYVHFSFSKMKQIFYIKYFYIVELFLKSRVLLNPNRLYLYNWLTVRFIGNIYLTSFHVRGLQTFKPDNRSIFRFGIEFFLSIIYVSMWNLNKSKGKIILLISSIELASSSTLHISMSDFFFLNIITISQIKIAVMVFVFLFF